MPALCRHSVDVLMQISPQGLCAHGQGRGQELHSTSSGDYPRILWHCSRLQSWWKTRESSFSYQNLGCCDPGLRGLWGENTKSVCWDGPGGMQEVLGQPTASGGRFPGRFPGDSQPLLTWLIPRKRDPYRLCKCEADMGNISSKCCVKLQKVIPEETGKGREKSRRNRKNQDIFPLVYQLNKGYQLMRFQQFNYFSLRGTACDLWLSYSFTDHAAIKVCIIYCFLLCHAQLEMASIKRD